MTDNYEKCVKGKVFFDSYMENTLYFKCDSGLRFSVPIDELNTNVVITNEEQGINFFSLDC